MNAISAAKMRRNLEFATPYTCLAALVRAAPKHVFRRS